MTPGADPRLRPPALACWLLRAGVDRTAWEIVSGDLQEEFGEACARLGARAARRQFWRHTLASIGARWFGARREARPQRTAPGASRMGTLLRDLHDGVRQCRRSPAVWLTAVVTLALGIAATTTIFGLLNAFVLRPLPYDDASRVTFVLGREADSGDLLFKMPYRDIAEIVDAGIFADVAMYNGLSANLSGAGLPERVQAYLVSPNTFDLLGVDAALGRTFRDVDVASGGDRLVVLSHGLWMGRFGGDLSIVGRTIALNGEAYTVTGVMPESFEFPVVNFKGDLWTPLVVTPADRTGSSMVPVARLAPGESVETSQAKTDALMARLAAARPETNANRDALVVPMGQLGAEQAMPVFVLLGIAGVLVLLVACVNVANLLLARGVARGRELAVRAALGAGRLRLLRMLLVESALMAVAGGLLAAGLTRWSLAAVRAMLPEFVVRVAPGANAVAADLDAMAFAAGVSLLTVLLFGLLPAWQAARASASDALASGVRVTVSRRRRWLRQSLVVVEVAMSVALLVVTGLIGRSAQHLVRQDPGFDKDHVLAVSVSLPQVVYPEGPDRENFFLRLTDAVRAIPGVEAVGLVHVLPFSTSDSSGPFEVVGAPPIAGPRPVAGFRVVSPGYFDAMGMSLLDGRGFDPADGRPDRRVLVVNRAFARRYLGEGRAVDRQLGLPGLGDDREPYRVVGVVSDVLHTSLRETAVPEIYAPYAHVPRATMTLAVRTSGEPVASARAVRTAIASIDPALAAFDVAPLSTLVGNSHFAQAIALRLMRVLSAGALVLAAVGLYGVLSFTVGQRSREIGVRVALGATTRDVLSLVLRQTLWLLLVGLGVGIAIAAIGAGALSALLFGVGPLDPIVYAGTGLVLAAVGLLASYAPARRALRVDPASALRVE
jgi:predicted permease